MIKIPDKLAAGAKFLTENKMAIAFGGILGAVLMAAVNFGATVVSNDIDRSSQSVLDARVAAHRELQEKAAQFVDLGTRYGESLEAVLQGEVETIDREVSADFASNISEQILLLQELERYFGESPALEEYSADLLETRRLMPVYIGDPAALQPFWQSVANTAASQNRALETVNTSVYGS